MSACGHATPALRYAHTYQAFLLPLGIRIIEVQKIFELDLLIFNRPIYFAHFTFTVKVKCAK